MSARIVVVAGPDRGRVFPLRPGETLQVGRSQASSTRLTDPSISRVHCEIEFASDRPLLINLSSSGTLVNGRPVAQQELQPDDVIRVGGSELRYLALNPAEPPTLCGPGLADALAEVAGLVGRTLGDFTLEALLARSRTSAVFQAKDNRDGRHVALKVLPPEFARDDGERQRFLRTMKTVLPLHHPNLVRLLWADQVGPYCCMAMDLIDGESLSSLLRRLSVADILDWQDAHRIAVDVARALDYAHSRNILHRNVTPANILIRSRDRQALLGDLMLAKALAGTLAEQLTRPGELLGDLLYLAPERTRLMAEVDARADLYGLGATLYHLLTGRPPFVGDSITEVLTRVRSAEPEPPSRFQPGVSPAFEKIVLGLLAKEPDDRPATAATLLADLAQVKGSDPGSPRTSGKALVAAYPFLSPPQQRGEIGRLGHYRVLHLLGEGGMGMVFEAEDSQLQRPVALKVMKPELVYSVEGRERFLREARAGAALHSDHAVTVYQVGQDQDVPYLAMELLQGESLQAWLDRGGQATIRQILRIGREIATGLEAAHGVGLIHRDIKPANLWLESPRGRVKILDFGLALPTRATTLTRPGMIVGTLGYMAPEQAKGEPVDARCDLFSLGCVLYRLCTGQFPIAGEDTMALLTSLAVDVPAAVATLNPDVPPGLAELVDQLLAKSPAERVPSARAVVAMIRKVEIHLPLS